MIDKLLTGLPPVYSHTDTLLARAADEGPMRTVATRAWRAMAEDPGRAGFALSHHLRRSARVLRSWERRLVAAGLYALVRGHALVAALLGAELRDARALWLGWLVLQGLPVELTRVHMRCDATPLTAERVRDAAATLLAALPDDTARLAVGASVPRALAERLRADLGDAAAAFLVASNRRAPLTLRVNRALASRAAVLEALAADGIGARRSALAPDAIVLEGRCDVRSLALYAEGRVEVQDAGSQRVTALVGVRPGERVVDLCAGAGGKTLALAAALGGAGEVYAYDVRKARLEALRERAARCGVLERVRVDALPAAGSADAVLVDAPCTGSGTLRREPELRWRLDEARIEAMEAAQAEVLEAGARLVRPGGRLVYVTCSVLAAENEASVGRFLAGHRGFVTPEPALRLTPHEHDCDGFFAQVLLRSG